MILEEVDFPLVAIGREVWSKRRPAALLVADSPVVARQVTATLNAQAEHEAPFCTAERWFRRQ